MSKSSTSKPSFKIETGVPVAHQRRKLSEVNAALLSMEPGQSLYPAGKSQACNAYAFARLNGFTVKSVEENGAYRIHKIASTR